MLKQIVKLSLPIVNANVKSSNFHVAASLNVKQILETRNGKQLVFEGINVPSPREDALFRVDEHSHACPVCRLNVDIKHTDVLILSQFIRTDGCMLPRRITGLCKMQQKRISHMVAMAQKAGLMTSLLPIARTRNVKDRRKEHLKMNYIFEESTIKWKDRFIPKPPKPRNNWF